MARRMIGGRRVGELEAEVLQQLWTVAEPVTGRELLERMDRPGLAYTTLMTILSRLAGKGLAQRVPDGRNVRYRAVGDADELTARAIGELLTSARDPHAVLAHLVGELSDPALLEDLAAVLDEHRRS